MANEENQNKETSQEASGNSQNSENSNQSKRPPKLNWKEAGDGILSSIFNYLNFLSELPNDVHEILEKVKDGKITHEVDFKNSQDLVNGLRNLATKIATSIFLGFLLITLVIILIFADFSQIWVQVSISVICIALLAVGYKMVFSDR